MQLILISPSSTPIRIVNVLLTLSFENWSKQLNETWRLKFQPAKGTQMQPFYKYLINTTRQSNIKCKKKLCIFLFNLYKLKDKTTNELTISFIEIAIITLYFCCFGEQLAN